MFGVNGLKAVIMCDLSTAKPFFIFGEGGFNEGDQNGGNNLGKKNRNTILPAKVVKATQVYNSLFKPNYWLFEGQDGGKYTDRSVQNILQSAVIKSGTDKHTTVHTFRHSFATHLIMDGIDIRKIQTYPGHESIKTTAIYMMHITDKMKSQIKSPIDDLDI